MEIRDAVAYLRLTVFDDNAAFERIVNKPRRRFGRVKSARLKALKADGISLLTHSAIILMTVYCVQAERPILCRL